MTLGLTACDKKDVCDSTVSLVDIAAGSISAHFDCNVDKVQSDLRLAVNKLPQCQAKGTQYSGINAGELKCSLAPMLARMVGDAAVQKWECKKVGSSLEDMLKKALKCS